ncbi:MAG TPA: hypothetical protein VG711_03090 [Phycisphaerales bacterium]|nr:hypothetical protein [Phycisphaerales bacterium]
MLPAKRILIWLDPPFAALIRAIAPLLEAEIVGLGSSSDKTSTELARQLEAPRFTDLRQAVLETDCDLLFLAIADEILPEVREAIISRNLPTALIQPPFDSINSAIELQEESHLFKVIPALRHSAGFRAAQEILNHIGTPHAITISIRASPSQSTLFGRLFDAMDLITAVFSDVESLSAALSAPRAASPETLSALHGSLSINLRLHDGACACALLTDSAGSWFRGATILGSNGCLRLTDTTVDWVDSTGRTIDPSHATSPLPAHEIYSEQINRLLSDLDTTDSPTDFTKILSICEAARLSARTNQEEAPRKMLSLYRLP